MRRPGEGSVTSCRVESFGCRGGEKHVPFEDVARNLSKTRLATTRFRVTWHLPKPIKPLLDQRESGPTLIGQSGSGSKNPEVPNDAARQASGRCLDFIERYMQHILNPNPQTLNPKSQAQNPKPSTPNPTPQNPNSESQTQNPEVQPPNPEPQTPNPEPQTRNPKS